MISNVNVNVNVNVSVSDRFRTTHNAILANFVFGTSLVVQIDDIVDLGIVINIEIINDLVIFVIIELVFVIVIERWKKVVAGWIDGTGG